MAQLQVTKDFQTFVNVEKCRAGEDVLIIHEPSNNVLRLTPKVRAYFSEWIEQNLMDGWDTESYQGMEHAKQKDEQEEKKHKRK